jgi:hypothetical protein
MRTSSIWSTGSTPSSGGKFGRGSRGRKEGRKECIVEPPWNTISTVNNESINLKEEAAMLKKLLAISWGTRLFPVSMQWRGLWPERYKWPLGVNYCLCSCPPTSFAS